MLTRTTTPAQFSVHPRYTGVRRHSRGNIPLLDIPLSLAQVRSSHFITDCPYRAITEQNKTSVNRPDTHARGAPHSFAPATYSFAISSFDFFLFRKRVKYYRAYLYYTIYLYTQSVLNSYCRVQVFTACVCGFFAVRPDPTIACCCCCCWMIA